MSTATRTRTKPAATAPAESLDAAVRARLSDREAERANVVLDLARRAADGEQLDADATAETLHAAGATAEQLAAATQLQQQRRAWAAMANRPADPGAWDTLKARRQAADEAYLAAAKQHAEEVEAVERERHELERRAGDVMRAKQRLVNTCADAVLLARERGLNTRRTAIQRRVNHLRAQSESLHEIVDGMDYPTAFAKLKRLQSRLQSLESHHYANHKRNEIDAVKGEIAAANDAILALQAECAGLDEQLAKVDAELATIAEQKLIP